MTSRTNRLVIAALATFFCILPGCSRINAKQSTPLHISLSNDGGVCKQNGITGIIDVEQDQVVIYQGANALNQFEVQFATCPFGSCPVTSSNGSPATAGPPKPGAAGNTYNYSGVTINNKPCGVSPGGLRVKPGP